MVRNDQELATTKAWIARFNEALKDNKTAPLRHPDPRMRAILHDALASQMDDLTIQAHVYETGPSLPQRHRPDVDPVASQNEDSPEGISERVALLELQILRMQHEIDALRALVFGGEQTPADRDTQIPVSVSR